MKNLLKTIIFTTLLFVWSGYGIHALPRITAPSYVLLEASNFEILAGFNENERRPPASTTKILTGILALDLADPDEIVQISKKAAKVGDASIYLQEGETFFLIDLLKGALINSGNDAAFAIAEQVAGDERLFLDIMNRKAKILGAINTHFTNPHGLPSDLHFSTAYDLAIIAGYSLQNHYFSGIVGTKYDQITSLNNRRRINLSNTNKLLWKSQEIKGVKTGTTIRSGKCLVSAAGKDERYIIAVVLKSYDRFGDAERLLDWGFTEFTLFNVAQKEYLEVLEISNGYPNVVTVKPSMDTALSIPKGEIAETHIDWFKNFSLPLAKGTALGELVITQNGQVIKKIAMVTGEDVLPRVFAPSLLEKSLSFIKLKD